MTRMLVIGNNSNLALQIVSILKDCNCPAEVFSDSHLSHDELKMSTIFIIGGQNFPGKFLRRLPIERERREAEISKYKIPLVPVYLDAADIIAVRPTVDMTLFKGDDLAGLKTALSHNVSYVDPDEQKLRRQIRKSKKILRAEAALEEKREGLRTGRCW
jgi:hypothetical protein